MSAAWSALLLAPLPFALLWAAASDLQRFLIPNRASALCALGVLPALLASGLGLEAIANHLAAGFAALALGFGLFALGLWGGGDGKLFAAASLWFDPIAGLGFLYMMVLTGGALGLLALALRAYASRLAPRFGLPTLQLGRWATHAPYGLAIAIGALVAFPDADLFAALTG